MSERLHLDHGVVNSFLRGLRYPISKADLVKLAGENDVVGKYLDAFERLPDRSFASQSEVMAQLQSRDVAIT